MTQEEGILLQRAMEFRRRPGRASEKDIAIKERLDDAMSPLRKRTGLECLVALVCDGPEV
jgi:hypothetical protein